MSTQSSFNFTVSDIVVVGRDPSARKHRNNPQSDAAHEKIVQFKPDKYEQIVKFILSHGPATVHQIAKALGFGEGINRVSGRLSELKGMNVLYETTTATGEVVKVKGAAVLSVNRSELLKRGVGSWFSF